MFRPVHSGEAGLRGEAQPDPLPRAEAPSADCHDSGTAVYDRDEQESGFWAGRRALCVTNLQQGYPRSQGDASCLSTDSQYRYRLSELSAGPMSSSP